MPASEPVRWGRKRVLPSCPNPLFLQWLTELRDEAKEKGRKTQFTYQKAINSLTKYPLPLRSAREAKILQNFGDGICKILDDRLQRYYREEGPNAPIHPLPAGAPPAGGADNNRLEASRATKAAGDEEEGGGGGGRRRKREYVPQRRSGGFAVLLALYRHSQLPGNKGFMLKMELQSEAQRLCDRSFTAPDPGSRYTAWSSVRTLIHKNLVLKTHSPARFGPLRRELRAPAGRELVLDFIVERKRMDDLCGSIMDGRFREQKFRLKRCGLHRPIYLVEGGGASASHLSLPEATLQQAIVNTQVVDGFFVKRVQDVRESAAYLTIMTRYLTSLYQNRALTCRSRELEGDAAGEEEEGGAPSSSLMSFAEFNHGAVKNKCQTVREVFARQLMQISGLSGDKAAAVLEHYSTPDSLLAAYDRCSSEAEKEKLLSCIRYGKLKRNVGPALSRTVYQLYCTPGALS
ncbi:crossover junction endonuclease MUS81 [Nematolebias whitei]|uniref:crossover junction endonuclease MUS81 n=1 Tax=Nematolebias whitei TaxID=451745 RepID=UPI001898E3BF|nr:crossover junction endonuclease MUS81 [Nematolebias whitei]